MDRQFAQNATLKLKPNSITIKQNMIYLKVFTDSELQIAKPTSELHDVQRMFVGRMHRLQSLDGHPTIKILHLFGQ